MPKLLYVLPASSVHGGIRVVLDHANGLAARGWDVTVVGPDPAPGWHPLRVPYVRVDLARPSSWPAAEVAIGTFWTTIGPAVATGAPTVLHFCQGYEGVHREYGPILDEIRAAYRLPVAKLLVSPHLEPVLRAEHGELRSYLLGQFVDSELFSPAPAAPDGDVLRIGLVGPCSVRSKGIDVALRGLAAARAAGRRFELHRAAAEPMQEVERDLGITDVYHESLDTTGMVDFYRGLDALVFSSFDEEGYPLPPLEAMACGVAVGLTRIRPFDVVPEDAAARWEPGRAEQLPALVEAFADPRRRGAWAAAGHEYATGLTLDRVLDRLEAALLAEGVPRP